MAGYSRSRSSDEAARFPGGGRHHAGCTRPGAAGASRLSASIKTRAANKVGILYKTKHGQPNGLAMVDGHPDQMWVLDQGAGHFLERVQLPDDSPAIHCAKLVGDQMVACDDMGWLWRFKI